MRARTILAGIGATLALLSTSPVQSATLPADTVNQGRISVQVQGSGTDIILIPGFASSSEVWADLASRLRQNHRLHLVQVAGFAGSPAVSDLDGKVVAPTAEAISDYIRSQHIKAPVIIGHSLGGGGADAGGASSGASWASDDCGCVAFIPCCLTLQRRLKRRPRMLLRCVMQC